MIIFPAIDIKDETCVRLYQGEMNSAEKVAESVYKVIVDTGYDSDRAAADPRNDVGHADRNSFKNI